MSTSTTKLRWNSFIHVAGIAILVVGCSALAWAQVESGTIAGVVRDSSGAVMPAARVVVTNVTTGVERSTDTSSAGDFSVPFLAAGRYNLEVSKEGFQTYVQRDFGLDVAQTLRLDFVLSPGSVRQEVVVSGQAPLLQTDEAKLGQLIDHQQVVDLPLNGRNFMNLASLTAGTANNEPGARDANAGGFSSNGGRSYDNNIMLDGVDNNNLSPDLRNGTDFIVQPIPDAIGEFVVETNGYGPEFGRGGGAAVNIAMRSGTNKFHGDAWEFLRNNALDARNFFDYTTAGAPPYKQNQFGFTAGGPIVRNHTFFFGDYQGTRIRQSLSDVSVVPTALEQTGNFSDGYLPEIYEPGTNTPWPNQIITSGLDPAALQIAKLFPLPNIAGTDEFAYNPLETENLDQLDVRIDHQLKQSTLLFARVSYAQESLVTPGGLTGLMQSDLGRTATTGTRGVALGITHTFTPTIVNDFRFGYARLNERELNPLSNVDAVGQYNIPGIQFVSGLNGGLPSFAFTDVQSLTYDLCDPTFETTNVFTYRDVLNVVHGKHSMKMGFEIRPGEFTIYQPCNSRGYFGYDGQFTASLSNANSGSSFGDFLLGMPDIAYLSNLHNIDYVHDNYAIFWGDSWRVSNRLTLNLGLRWEYHNPIAEKFGAQASLGLNDTDYYVSSPVTLPSSFPFNVVMQGKYLNSPEHHDWAPRVGFAYQITPKTVVRGAYGIYYQAEEIGTYSNPSPGFNPPFYNEATYPAVSLTQVNPTVNLLENGFPAGATSALSINPDSIGYVQLQSNLDDAYVQSWNFTLQRQLTGTSTLEVAYAGNKGTDLINFATGNQATPTSNPNAPIAPRAPMPFLTAETGVILSNLNSSYNGLLVTLRQRLSHGLSVNAAYTWSHALDYASSSNLGSANNGYFRDYNNMFWEYGNADFDERNRITVFYEYQLPVGSGRAFASHPTRWLDGIIGGWSTLGIWTYHTGNWFTPVLSYDPSNSESPSPRPNMVCNPNVGAPHTTADWFNINCFADPPLGSFGNAGRNVILGPSYFDSDLSLLKHWSFSESRRIEFRAEFFNAFNHPTFPALSDLTPGVTHFGAILTANAPRQIQGALKFFW